MRDLCFYIEAEFSPCMLDFLSFTFSLCVLNASFAWSLTRCLIFFRENTAPWRDTGCTRHRDQEIVPQVSNGEEIKTIYLRNSLLLLVVFLTYVRPAQKWHPDKNPDNPEAKAKVCRSATAICSISRKKIPLKFLAFLRCVKRLCCKCCWIHRW